MRALKIEARKKEKIITKKTFQIGNLLEKIKVLEKSNASLFKELDQTIGGFSIIQQQSQLDIVIEENQVDDEAMANEEAIDSTPKALIKAIEPAIRKSGSIMRRQSSEFQSMQLRA